LFWQPWWIERCLAAISRRGSQQSRPHFPHAESVGSQSVRAAGLLDSVPTTTSRSRPEQSNNPVPWVVRFLRRPFRFIPIPLSAPLKRLQRLFKPGDFEELF
jgi:hypothetical protein